MTSKILPLYDGDSLEKTVQTVTEAIRSGKTAVIPTDTVYGLVADPLSVSAVQGIFRAKHRPPEKTVQILCSNPEQARKLGLIIPHIYEQLLDIFPPGSLCLVCPVISTCPLVTTRTVSGGDGDVNANATAADMAGADMADADITKAEDGSRAGAEDFSAGDSCPEDSHASSGEAGKGSSRENYNCPGRNPILRTQAVRFPSDSATQAILNQTGPLAASSANRSGRQAATTAAEALDQLGDEPAVYADGGVSSGPAASTVISLDEFSMRTLACGWGNPLPGNKQALPLPRLIVLREGIVSLKELREQSTSHGLKLDSVTFLSSSFPRS